MKDNKYTAENYNHVAKTFSNESVDDLSGQELERKNSEEYSECAKTWNILNEMREIDNFNTDKAWDNLHSKLDNENLIDERKTKVLSMQRIIAIAASVAILISIGFYTANNSLKKQDVYANNSQETKIITLVDGSKVYLNANSSISLASSFNEKVREIELSGEAFFEISRNEDKPFIVNVNGAQVKVLGTSFNVNPESDNGLEVTVRTGKVQLCDCLETGENVILIKGEKGNLANHSLSKMLNDRVNYLAWINKKLIFKSTPLSEVVKDINASYHSNIVINDEIATMLLTTTYDSLSVEEVIESLSLTFNLVVEHDNNQVLLYR